jgi:hypothetical protein
LFKEPKLAVPLKATWKEKIKQMDLVGVGLAMGMIISFILATEHGQTEAWSSSIVVGLLVGFVLILATLIAWEWWLDETAMIPKRILGQRFVWSNAGFSFFLGGAYFVILYYLPIYFQSVDNASPINSGVRNLPMVISVSIAAMISGTLTTKTGQVWIWLPLGAGLATIAAGLFYTLGTDSKAGLWIGFQIIAGFGFGFAWQAPMVRAQAESKPEDVSSTSAIVFCMPSPASPLLTQILIRSRVPNYWRRLHPLRRPIRLHQPPPPHPRAHRALNQPRHRHHDGRDADPHSVQPRSRARGYRRVHGGDQGRVCDYDGDCGIQLPVQLYGA